MFLHTAERGQKEAEHMVCWDHWGRILGPDPETGLCHGVGGVLDILQRNPRHLSEYLSAMKATRTSLLWGLTSLKDWLHRHQNPAAAREDPEPGEVWQSWPNRQGLYAEAFRVACQRPLGTAEALQADIERLSWRARDRSWACSRTCSWTCSRSCSRSRSRSHSRAYGQSHPWSGSLGRQPRSPNGPLPGSRVTCREPEVRPNFEGSMEDYSSEPSVSDVEIWLEWQAWQLGTPAWWSELRAIPEVKDLWKLSCKIQASFYIPEVRMRPSLEQGYTAPPASRYLNRNALLLDELSYQDIWQQPTLLTVAYARGLQYWVEKLNPPKSLDLCPLAGSVVELRETVQEYVPFHHWDAVQGLGVIHLGSTSQWPQATLFSRMLLLPVEEQDFMETTTHTASPVAEKTWLDVLLHHLEQKERTSACWSLLPLWGSLTWDPVAITTRFHNWSTWGKHILEPTDGCHFLWIYQISYGGATVKELNEGCNRPHLKSIQITAFGQ